MANVRLDDNGLPKGPVYEPTAPQAHRSNVTSVDSSDPPDTSAAVDTIGYQHCRFDIDLDGAGFQALEVQALFWNLRQNVWFGGASRRFTSTGKHALLVETQGAIIFLKVTSFTGTSFTLSADYTLS
jgi:hypothetical protein